MAIDPATAAAEAEKMAALGLVVNHAALMEHDLERAFTLLVGSEYAAAVAAGQTADWLMQNCRTLATARQDIPEYLRTAIMDALDECKAASQQRNTLVHAIKTNSERDGRLETILTRRGGRQHVETWTPSSIRQVANELLDSCTYLMFTVEQALEAGALMRTGRTYDDRQDRA